MPQWPSPFSSRAVAASKQKRPSSRRMQMVTTFWCNYYRSWQHLGQGFSQPKAFYMGSCFHVPSLIRFCDGYLFLFQVLFKKRPTQDDVKVSQQETKNIIVEKSCHKYYAVDDAWQKKKCVELHLPYHSPNGVQSGSSQTPLGTPVQCVETIGDGSCFYRSLSYLITGSSRHYMEVSVI